jgi:ubiquinone biosynthesis protein UbiJ
MLKEFIDRDDGPLVRAEELERFATGVDDLQAAVEKLERRLAGPDRDEDS